MKSLFAILLVSVALTSVGCKKKKTDQPATTETGSAGSAMAAGSAVDTGSAGSAVAATGSAAAPAGPTDAQIAAIVVAANQVDIDAGEMAAKKTKNADVKKFAELMVTDHTAINKAAGDLVKKLGVTPEENDTSKSLVKGGDDNKAALEKLSGAEFDKAYVDHEVAYHQTVLDALDKTLIPSAQNAELKSTLVGVRPLIDAHLKHAQEVQAALAGGGSAAGAHHHK